MSCRAGSALSMRTSTSLFAQRRARILPDRIADEEVRAPVGGIGPLRAHAPRRLALHGEAHLFGAGETRIFATKDAVVYTPAVFTPDPAN